MKRPVSILFLSDIHYNSSGDMHAVDTLYRDFAKYLDQDVSRRRWQPDYVAVVGDISDHNCGYDGAASLLKRLIGRDVFNIPDEHVILVPGNHDKTVPEDEAKLASDKALFENFSGHPEKHAGAFAKVFSQRFKSYMDFCDRFQGSYRSPRDGKERLLSDERMQCLSGVKAFEEDHLCFLTVNSEWLYVPRKWFVKKMEAQTGAQNSHVVINERCTLCAPLVKEAREVVRRYYGGWTVVSLMHRGFDRLYGDSGLQGESLHIDAADSLVKVSDLIVTGHDHTLSLEPPTFIQNRTQHIRLGAVGRTEPKGGELFRSAEIVHIDAARATFEQLFLSYESSDERWHFTEKGVTYPLPSYYRSEQRFSDERKPVRGHRTVLQAAGCSETAVRRAVETYFGDTTPYQLVLVKAGDNLCERLRQVVENNVGSLFVVVYSLYPEHYSVSGNFSADTKQAMACFRDEMMKELMSGRMVLTEVTVDYPIDYSA